MSFRTRAALTGLLALTALTAVAGPNDSPRQYYGGWQKHKQRPYYYRQYYYKPAPTYVGYKHHYVMYFPKEPKHYYFYNPYSKKYWGRCPVNSDGQGLYSRLAEKDQSGTLADIPEAAFPAATKVPSIPGATDNVGMELPPDDLPQDDGPSAN